MLSVDVFMVNLATALRFTVILYRICQYHFSVSQHPHKYNPSVRNFTAGLSHQIWVSGSWATD